MRYIGENDTLFDLLESKVSILSSQILGINIHLKDFTLVIDVDIKMLYGKEKYLKLIFSGIKEYAFNYSADHIFYNIEVYKLVKRGKLFYISFDPYDNDLSEISEDDNDLILCESFEGYFY